MDLLSVLCPLGEIPIVEGTTPAASNQRIARGGTVGTLRSTINNSVPKKVRNHHRFALSSAAQEEEVESGWHCFVSVCGTLPQI